MKRNSQSSLRVDKIKISNSTLELLDTTKLFGNFLKFYLNISMNELNFSS